MERLEGCSVRLMRCVMLGLAAKLAELAAQAPALCPPIPSPSSRTICPVPPPPLPLPLLQWAHTGYDELILDLQRRAYESAVRLVSQRRTVIQTVATELCENRWGGGQRACGAA